MVVNLSKLFGGHGPVKLHSLDAYVRKVLDKVSPGDEVVLTGQAPVWLYLRIAHELHGVARSLYYESPVTGRVEVFNHDPL